MLVTSAKDPHAPQTPESWLSSNLWHPDTDEAPSQLRGWHFLKGVQSTWGELYTILGDDAPAESNALGNQSGFVYVQLHPCELHLTKILLQSVKVLVLRFCVGSNVIQSRLRMGFEILDNAFDDGLHMHHRICRSMQHSRWSKHAERCTNTLTFLTVRVQTQLPVALAEIKFP
jgi:hypothetical protein